ncbi:ribosome maturation factor RimM [Alphaproteobacteria bacterium]|nr:ribosome maturation factor RimM [Alphaproteobacteria bacterium]
MSSQKVTIGKIVSPHGVKGLFKVLIYSENEDSFFSHKSYFKVKNKKIDIIKKFNKGNFIVCESTTIQNRDQVAEIINEDIVISATGLKKNNKNKNEFFHMDLIGCKVINFNSEDIGNVKAIHNFGAGDILELDGKFPYMIRFEQIKKENINLKKSIIKVDLKVLENN